MTRLACTLFLVVFASTASANSNRVLPGSTSDAMHRRTAEIQMVSAGREYNDITEYDITVDGEHVTVAIGSTGSTGQVAVYDDDGGLVVGYRFSPRHMIIYDSDGLVSHGAPGEVTLNVMAEYGTAPMLLTDPAVLSRFVSSSAGRIRDDEALTVKWGAIFSASEVMALSCVDSITVHSSDTGQYGFDWTCPGR